MSFVQGAFTNVQSATLAYPGNNTAGNCLVVFAHSANGSGTPTITDTQGNTWTSVVSTIFGITEWMHGWIAPNCKAGANTISVGGGSGVSLQLCVLEYSTVALASPVDVSSGPSPSSASVTTTQSSDLLIMNVADVGGSTSAPGQTGSYNFRFGGGGTYGGTPRNMGTFDTVTGSPGSYSNGSVGFVFLLALKAAPPVLPQPKIFVVT